MSWSDRGDDSLPRGHPERRPAPSDGLLSRRFWRETADRAVKTGVQAVLLLWGGEAVNAWTVDWGTTAGVAVGGALLSVLTSVASAPFGDRSSPSTLR